MSAIAIQGRPARLTPGRSNVYHFLRRCQRYHATISGVIELDATDLLARLAAAKASGEPASFVAALVKAASLTVARHPKLNRHLFHGLWGPYEVSYPQANCGLLVRRQDENGEDILFPAVIGGADRLSIAEIHRRIERCKKAPLTELPEYRKFSRLLKAPRLLLPLLSYKLRSDHRFFERAIGATFGVSSFAGVGRVAMTPTQTLSPYGCSFLPGVIQDRPWIVDGEVRPRRILTLTSSFDHFLVDGAEGLAALNDLKALIENPVALGLGPAEEGETAPWISPRISRN